MFIETEEVGTTDPIFILRWKRSCRSSRNILIRESAYENVRDRTVLPLHQIETVKMDIKRRMMVHLNKNPGEDDGCRMNPDSSSGIYMTAVK